MKLSSSKTTYPSAKNMLRHATERDFKRWYFLVSNPAQPWSMITAGAGSAFWGRYKYAEIFVPSPLTRPTRCGNSAWSISPISCGTHDEAKIGAKITKNVRITLFRRSSLLGLRDSLAKPMRRRVHSLYAYWRPAYYRYRSSAPFLIGPPL